MFRNEFTDLLHYKVDYLLKNDLALLKIDFLYLIDMKKEVLVAKWISE